MPPAIKPWVRWLLAWHRLSAPALFLWSFVLLIALGTLGLLTLPGLERGPSLGFIDALFTITSAVCVTGLIVVDTPTHFTGLGQAWILLFIQLGGIGLISLTTMLIGAMGRRLSLRSEMLAVSPVRRSERVEVWQLALAVTRFSLIVEALGAAVLFVLWLPRFPTSDAVWHAVFHSVSAYCNAGFSTFSTSLIDLQDSPLSLIVISVLLIVGGLGYLTFEELTRWWKTARATRSGLRLEVQSTRRLSSHTWSVITTTGVLLVAGWVLFAAFEWSGTLGHLSVGDKLANAWMLSATPRTAGFNNIDYGQVTNHTAALTMLLMFIGGSPGSTAGGIKTTTVAVLLSLSLARFQRSRFVAIQGRAVPPETVERTVGLVILALLVVTAAFFALNAIEAVGVGAEASRSQFLPIAFETVSAFATVGLSMNFTPELEDPSKLLVILLMFIGRVGLFSFFTAVVLRRSRLSAIVRPAQEDLIVG